jgi:hypothetical protein
VQCRACASSLDRPGDYCLVCRTSNADAVVIATGADRATVSSVLDDRVVGERTVTAVRESDGRRERAARRNFAGRIVDEVRRKRPDAVYAMGDHDVIRAVDAALRHDLRRVDGDDPVAAARGDDEPLATVETAPADKLGGTHTTLIGGREGRQAIETAASHPHVKKVVPGPIDAGGSGSSSGMVAKATRADGNGNLRLLLRDGSSVQETRVVTTASSTDDGERVRADLNDALSAAGLQ